MENHHEYKDNKEKGSCECIFCLSKCPECGSKNIIVTYKPEFEYSYSSKSHCIVIKFSVEKLEIICRDCYKSFTSDSLSQKYSALFDEISDAIKLSSYIYVNLIKN
jgi:hypothetical protein